MSSTCTIHNVLMQQRESKTKFEQDGSPKIYFAHIANGEMCFGESVRKGQTRNGQVNHDVAPPKKDHDGMLKCNAMNNAVAMVNAGIIADASLEAAFKRILSILEN